MQAQYSKNSTFPLRYFLVWPETPPDASTPIFLFMGQEQPLLYVLQTPAANVEALLVIDLMPVHCSSYKLLML